MPKNPDMPTSAATSMPVQVCYLAPGVQARYDLQIPYDATLSDALRLSGVVQKHPEIDLTVQQVGVFGKIKALTDRLSEHDRIEIYRPLTVDPKVARARRVAKSRKGGSTEGRKWARREA